MLFSVLMAILGLLVIFLIGFVLLVASAHKKVPQGKALIRTGFGGAIVALDSGMFGVPILHKVEELDITIKTIKISESVKCLDNELLRVDISFFVRVNRDSKYVIEVAQTIGCEQAGKQETIENLFRGKFLEAIQEIAAQYNANDLWKSMQKFKSELFKTIGVDLSGFLLDDCAIEKIQKMPNPNLGKAVFVLLDSEKSLEKGEKVVVIDKINGESSYIVRRIQE